MRTTVCSPVARVEPKGASHVFIVHGSECRTTASHPHCTYNPQQSSSRKGMMYVIDIEAAMGTDWKVSNMEVHLVECLLSIATVERLAPCGCVCFGSVM